MSPRRGAGTPPPTPSRRRPPSWQGEPGPRGGVGDPSPLWRGEGRAPSPQGTSPLRRGRLGPAALPGPREEPFPPGRPATGFFGGGGGELPAGWGPARPRGGAPAGLVGAPPSGGSSSEAGRAVRAGPRLRREPGPRPRRGPRGWPVLLRRNKKCFLDEAEEKVIIKALCGEMTRKRGF